MAVALTINDVSQPARRWEMSVRMKRGERPTANFVSDTRFEVGQKVGIFDGGVRRFGGTIDSISNRAKVENMNYLYGHASGGLEYSYECVGWEQIFDRRVVEGAVYGGAVLANASTDVLTQYAHGLSANQRVRFASSGTLPAGLATSTTYFARDITTNTFKVAATSGGSAIDITDAGTGAHRLLWRSTDIVLDIVANHVAGESITTTGVADGPFLEKQVFDYVTASEALAAVAELAAMDLYIDPSLVLYFEAEGTQNAPFSLVSSANVFDLHTVLESREDYRNRQRIRIDAPPVQSQDFPGDDVTTVFYLDSRPSAIVRAYNSASGNDYSVGVWGTDTGMDFYWSVGDRAIIQDLSGTPITTGESLIVLYRSIGDNIITVDDAGAQSDRATVEGNSGIYDRIESAPASADQSAATNYANALLNVFGMVQEVTYRSANTGFYPGQGQGTNLPAHDITSEIYYVDAVTLTVEDGVMFSEVMTTNGQRRRRSAELFRSFQAGGESASTTVAGGGVSAAQSGYELDGVPVTY